jgi:hypothetical protein
MDWINIQMEVCNKYNSPFIEAPLDLRIGIALNVRDGIYPINGLRHKPEREITGWFIWAGERFSHNPDFFVPLHVAHLSEWCPNVIKYLGLSPGWRFLIAPPSYEDVWVDKSLLEG